MFVVWEGRKIVFNKFCILERIISLQYGGNWITLLKLNVCGINKVNCRYFFVLAY